MDEVRCEGSETTGVGAAAFHKRLNVATTTCPVCFLVFPISQGRLVDHERAIRSDEEAPDGR